MNTDAREALVRAKAILDGIGSANFRAANGQGPLEDSAFYLIGQAMGEIQFALICMDAHEEVYHGRACTRPCLDRRVS